MAGTVATKSEKDNSAGKAAGRAPELSRRSTSCDPYADIKDLQNIAGNQAVNQLLQPDKGVPPIVREVLNSGNGKPLDPDTRAYMEDRFNAGFSNVRIHDNPAAHASAKALSAKAFTHSSNIVFSDGWYEPASLRSQKLIAHELTHVIQQSRGGSIQPTIDGTGSLEISARQASESAISGQGNVAVAGASAIGIASEPMDEKLKDDPQVVAKLKALVSTLEGSDVNNIQGTLFEDLINSQIQSQIKDNRDIEKILPPLPKEVSASSIKFVDKHPNDLAEGEATFVEAKRNDKPFIQIRTLGPSNAKGERASIIKNFSDGAVFVRVKGELRTKIIEGKSGERRKSDLWRGARDDDSQKTTWPVEQAKVRKEAQQGLHEYDPDNPSVGRTPAAKSLRFKETEEGGQIRSDLEALDGGTLLVGGKEVKVSTRPSEVGFLAVTPHDVDIADGIKKLNKMGLQATSDTVPVSASTIRSTAEQVVTASKQKSGSPLPATTNPPKAPAAPVSDTKAAKPSASAAVTASASKTDKPKTTVPVKTPAGKKVNGDVSAAVPSAPKAAPPKAKQPVVVTVGIGGQPKDKQTGISPPPKKNNAGPSAVSNATPVPSKAAIPAPPAAQGSTLPSTKAPNVVYSPTFPSSVQPPMQKAPGTVDRSSSPAAGEAKLDSPAASASPAARFGNLETAKPGAQSMPQKSPRPDLEARFGNMAQPGKTMPAPSSASPAARFGNLETAKPGAQSMPQKSPRPDLEARFGNMAQPGKTMPAPSSASPAARFGNLETAKPGTLSVPQDSPRPELEARFGNIAQPGKTAPAPSAAKAPTKVPLVKGPAVRGLGGKIRGLGGRVKSGARSGAGALALVILQILMAKQEQDWENERIERDIARLEPKILESLNALKTKATEIKKNSPDEDVYANITIRIRHNTRLRGQGPSADLDTVYSGSEISAVNVSTQNIQHTKKEENRYLGGVLEYTIITYSDQYESMYQDLEARKETMTLFSDTEIRDWLKTGAPSVIQGLPVYEKIRLINRLIDGWISDEDVSSIERICQSVVDTTEALEIRDAISPRLRKMNNLGQRLRVRYAIQKMSG